MKKARLADKLHEKKEKENWGKGTTVLNSWKEFEKIEEQFSGKLISPGGAAAKLSVSRAYINQLEKDGKLRVYRIMADDIVWKDIPFWVRWMVPQKEVYIFIPDDDVEKVHGEMLKQAKARIKKLEGK